MKSLFLSLATCLFLTSAAAQQPIEVLVHRGANSLAPENTVASALAALDYGASWIEVDVRQSSDGVLYNLHDETLDRTTNGHGPIARMRSADIDRLDAGSWFSPRFAGTRVPTIATMLDSLKGRANVFFDVKDGVSLPRLISLVRSRGWQHNSFFWFGSRKMQDRFVRLAPELKIKVNAESYAELQQWMRVCRPMAIEISPAHLTDSIRNYCRARGIKIMAALMMKNGDEAYREAINCHPDMVNLDQPERFRQVLRQLQYERNRTAAFMSDAHIQDVISHPELLRTMNVQVQSTRLFNENIFALRAALDDAARRQAGIVVLTGDMTDNGQLVNQHAAARILHEYERRYGMSFFMTVGNHDPKSPFGTDTEEANFLAADGSSHAIVSDSSLYSAAAVPPVQVDTTLRSAGYEEQMRCYSRFGFFPRADYLYWETPFSAYTPDSYSLFKAQEAASIANRTCTYCDSLRAIDASYLAEPVQGLWLMAIDAGVYLPDSLVNGRMTYKNSSVGYNNVLRHKHHLLSWVRRVTAEARRRGKTLIAFSHYPLADFNDGASPIIRRAWGNGAFDIDRVPAPEVTDSFLEAGLRLHFAGHMHVNDKATYAAKDGRRLVNIQIPSLATCMPAYKLVTIGMGGDCQVSTVPVDSVPGFDAFFDRYRREYAYEKAHGRRPVWSIEALQSRSYQQFCDWQFRDLTRVRFIERDLPEVLRRELLPRSGAQLLQRIAPRTADAEQTMDSWTGFDLVLDLYRLHYADSLALALIPAERMRQYDLVFSALRQSREQSPFISQMRSLAAIFNCFRRD
ncbi:glycerophosphodiester phosphodiesterase family protein [Prevotella sp. kh1p2]|uniref:glycerophosphodiester phosphodiesterase family protein n=1 Tax=Prevotella sp. kh1p2 TaxID=1761883 RepID=UPI0008AC1F7A|nr:glycerophosphodiester phosphodiesterase family protein [Prevotella sp. kh1p2]SES71251.1 Glycerophosphoryl diester phosphodiesterase [Prevotella sp. kh1p2]SNU10411.1 Glycerophosphoryl diester phosphodiesterase [Prevotellaceae bacterium KH2P17]